MTDKTYKELFMEGVRSTSEDAEVVEAIGILNQIFEHELAGAVRYTQYSMMIFGHARKPIQGSLQSWADESVLHARQAGELVTAFGGQVSLGIGRLNDCHHGDIDLMLRAMMDFELDSGDWVGMQLPVVLEQGVRDLSSYDGISLLYNVVEFSQTGNFDIYLQIGDIGEDLDGDGPPPDEEFSENSAGFDFDDSANGVTLRVGSSPQNTGNGRLDSEDIDGNGF